MRELLLENFNTIFSRENFIGVVVESLYQTLLRILYPKFMNVSLNTELRKYWSSLFPQVMNEHSKHITTTWEERVTQPTEKHINKNEITYLKWNKSKNFTRDSFFLPPPLNSSVLNGTLVTCLLLNYNLRQSLKKSETMKITIWVVGIINSKLVSQNQSKFERVFHNKES